MDEIREILLRYYNFPPEQLVAELALLLEDEDEEM